MRERGSLCDRDSLCERGSLREARGSLRERCSLRDYEYIILIICCSHKHNFAKEHMLTRT